jgi:hypothetical protein
MGGSINSQAWNMIAWNGPGTSSFIMPAEVICLEAEAVFTIELEGEVPVCDDDE